MKIRMTLRESRLTQYALIAVTLAFALLFVRAASATVTKVTLCHNPGPQQQTIEVSIAAKIAHLLHGDYEGACFVPEGTQGSAGPQGPMGPQGIPGAVGPQGATGPQGVTGVAGVQGPAGPEGRVRSRLRSVDLERLGDDLFVGTVPADFDRFEDIRVHLIPARAGVAAYRIYHWETQADERLVSEETGLPPLVEFGQVWKHKVINVHRAPEVATRYGTDDTVTIQLAPRETNQYFVQTVQFRYWDKTE